MNQRLATATLLLTVLVAPGMHAQAFPHPNIERGFAADKTFAVGDVDSVNMFNGNMSLRIPIGPEFHVGANLSYQFALHYNSKVWDHELYPPKHPDLDATHKYVEAHPEIRSNAGIGWQLHLGRLIAPEDPTNRSEEREADPSFKSWVYESPDGAQHEFVPKLHPGDPATGLSPCWGSRLEGLLGVQEVQYTRDSTYTRMRLVRSCNPLDPDDASDDVRMVETPDGIVREFRRLSDTYVWDLVRIRDRNLISTDTFNEVTFSYQRAADDPDNRVTSVTVADSIGRSHVINYVSLGDPEYAREVVDSVVLDVASNASGSNQPNRTLTYDLTYIVSTSEESPGPRVSRGCETTQLYEDPLEYFVSVPFLNGIVATAALDETSALPTYQLDYYYTNAFPSDQPPPDDEGPLPTCQQAALRSLVLPTKGAIEWDYQIYRLPAVLDEYDVCYPKKFLDRSPGVRQRRYYANGLNTSATAVWRYINERVGPESLSGWPTCEGNGPIPRCGPDIWCDVTRFRRPPVRFIYNSVVAPDGQTTTNYYSTWSWVSSPAQSPDVSRRDYGLPFTRINAQGDATRTGLGTELSPFAYLSTQTCRTSACLDGAEAPVGESYVAWAADSEYAGTADGDNNKRQVAERTVFKDDCQPSCSEKLSVFGDFDGLGNFRKTTVSGFGLSFPRTTETDFNPSVSCETNGTTTSCTGLPTATAPWLVGMYTKQSTRAGSGRTFDENTGQAVTEGEEWLHREVSFDETTGLLERQRTLRLKASSPVRATDDVVEYFDHYRGNMSRYRRWGSAVQTSSHVSQMAADPGQAALDVTYTRQSAGAGSRYGDLLRVQVAGAAFPSIDYDVDPISGLPNARRSPSGFLTTFRHDILGRPEEIRPQTGALMTYAYQSATGTSGNARARAVMVVRREGESAKATPAADLPLSEFRYDGFGRLEEEAQQLPDGLAHRVTKYDATGRKWKVSELEFHPTPSHFTTTGYDESGRPISVEAPDGTTTLISYKGSREMTRTVGVDVSPASTTEVFDALGRLRSVTEDSGSNDDAINTLYSYDVAENLTEVLTEGVTQVRSFDFDGRGLLRSETHPERGTTTYTYDARGNLLSSKLTADLAGAFALAYQYDSLGRLRYVFNGPKTVKEFEYDDIPGYLYPKNGKLLQAKRHNQNDGTESIVAEQFEYEGAGEQLSLKRTIVDGAAFVQTFKYDLLGQLSTLDYPAVGDAFKRPQGFDYRNGLLTGITDTGDTKFAALQYHANGLVEKVHHLNGVDDTIAVDPSNRMARPRSIEFRNFGEPLGGTCPGVTFEMQSTNVVVNEGADALLSITLNADPTKYDFEWFQITPEGETSVGIGSSYTVINVTELATYFVKFRPKLHTVCGPEQDSPLVTVQPCKVRIESVPTRVYGSATEVITLSVDAAGPGALSYKWFWLSGQPGSESENEIANETASSIVLDTTKGDPFTKSLYRVKVALDCGSSLSSEATSDAITVTRCDPPEASIPDHLDVIDQLPWSLFVETEQPSPDDEKWTIGVYKGVRGDTSSPLKIWRRTSERWYGGWNIDDIPPLTESSMIWVRVSRDGEPDCNNDLPEVEVIIWPVLAAVVVHPDYLIGGWEATATVTLNRELQAGESVKLTIDPGADIARFRSSGGSLSSSVTLYPTGTSAAVAIVTNQNATALRNLRVLATFQYTSNGVIKSSGRQRFWWFRVRPPYIDSMTKTGSVPGVRSETLIGGMSTDVTITLDAAAPPGGANISLLTFGDAKNFINFPSSVVIAEGSQSVSFPIHTFETTTPMDLGIRASYGESNSGYGVYLRPYLSFSITEASVTGGRIAHGTVTWGLPATVDEVITLSSSNTTVAGVPATVTIPAGSSSASFEISTQGVSSPTIVEITATCPQGSVKGSLALNPATSFDVTLAATAAPSGSETEGTIILEGPAGPGGATFTLSSAEVTFSTNTSANTVVIPQGQSTINFGIETPQLFTSNDATITVTRGTETRQVILRLIKLSLTRVELSSATVMAGSSVTGTVYLSSPSAYDIGVNLWTTDELSATVSSPAIVRKGESSATFSVTALHDAPAESVQIVAKLSSTQVSSGYLTITPAVLGLSITPPLVVGGSAAQGTINLGGPGGGTVALSVSRPDLVILPSSSITIPPGNSAGTFSLTTHQVTQETVVQIEARTGNVIQRADLTLVAAQIERVEWTDYVLGGNPAPGLVWLTAVPLADTLVEIRYSSIPSSWTSFNVTVPAGQRSAPFTITTPRTDTWRTYLVDASCGGVTRRAYLRFGPYEVTSLALDTPDAFDTQRVNLTVSLNGAAPVGGVEVALTTSYGDLTPIPAIVTVPQGASNLVIPIDLPLGYSGEATLTATLASSTQSVVLTVSLIQANSFTITPSVAYGGQSLNATIGLNAAPGAPWHVVFTQFSGPASLEMSVPTVDVPAGQTSTTFTIGSTANALGDATLRINGGIARTVNFLPSVTSISSSLTTMTPSKTATGTVALNGVGGGTVTLTSSAPSLLSVPASVYVDPASTSATFTVTSSGTIAATTVVTVTATTGPSSRTMQITVQPTELYAFAFAPATVEGGTSTTGNIYLTNLAPAGGADVTLTNASGLVTVPATVTVPAGAATVTFPVGTLAVATTQSVDVSASQGGITKSATLTLQPAPPPAIATFTLDRTEAYDTQRVNLTITLERAAPVGGASVSLASSYPALTPVAAAVTVPQGQTNLEVPIDLPVGFSGSATITATMSGASKSVTLNVQLIKVASLSITPVSLYGSQPATGTITLNATPGAEWRVYFQQITGTAAGQVTVPIVNVPAGQTSTTFTISSTASAVGSLTVRASTTVAYSINYLPAVASVSSSLTAMLPATTATGTVTLNGTGGATVTLSSSNPALLSVPASVTVGAASTSATFTITSAASIPAATNVTITATTGPISKTTTISVVPCQAAPTITPPQSPTIQSGQTATLSVVASSTSPMTYAWFQGTSGTTTNPVGTNSASFTTPALTTTTPYWVRVSNVCGSANSATVTVTVAPPPPPQIARRQTTFSLASSQTSITANWPQPTQTGTLLIAVVSGRKDPNGAVIWTPPAGWVHATTQEWNNIKSSIYIIPNNAGNRTSERFTVAAGYHDQTLYLLEYSGVMATNPLDKSAGTGGNTNTGTVQSGNTANTVQPKELVITAFTTYTPTDFSSPTNGFVELYDKFVGNRLTAAVYERITTASGAQGHVATVGVPEQWTGMVVTFRSADTN